MSTVRFALAVALFSSSMAVAFEKLPEPPPLPRNVVYIGPVAFLDSMVHAEYERVLGNNVSAYLIPTYVNRFQNFPSALYPPEMMTGLGYPVSHFTKHERMAGADFGVRFYPWRQAPSGFWIAPLLSAYWGEVTFVGEYDSAVVSGPLFNLGGQLGYSWLFGNAFALSLGVGGGYGISLAPEKTITMARADTGDWQSPLMLPWSGLNLNARVSVGWAF